MHSCNQNIQTHYRTSFNPHSSIALVLFPPNTQASTTNPVLTYRAGIIVRPILESNECAAFPDHTYLRLPLLKPTHRHRIVNIRRYLHLTSTRIGAVSTTAIATTTITTTAITTTATNGNSHPIPADNMRTAHVENTHDSGHGDAGAALAV